MKNIVVIGGTKGIGSSVVQSLTDTNLYIIARSVDGFESTDKLHYIAANITQQPINVSAFPEAIDGIVYCPGSINLKPFHRFTEEDFVADWNINVMGAIKVLQALLPKLKHAPQASVVLFSTVAVSNGMPFHTSIAAAKGALEGLSRSLAAEWAPNIRVNCIAPSLTQTPLAEKLVNTPEKIDHGGKRHPMQRIGQPADIAEMACFLLSDKASWITGQVFHVDGGMSTLKV